MIFSILMPSSVNSYLLVIVWAGLNSLFIAFYKKYCKYELVKPVFFWIKETVIIITIIIIPPWYWKAGMASGGGESSLMARLGSLALDGSPPRDGVSIKILMVVSHHHRCPLNEWKMSEIRNNLNIGHGLELYVKVPGVPAGVPRLSSETRSSSCYCYGKVVKISKYCGNGMLL